MSQLQFAILVILLGAVAIATTYFAGLYHSFITMLDEIRYCLDPDGELRESKESEERGELIAKFLRKQFIAESEAETMWPRESLNGSEWDQVLGKEPLNHCICGKIYNSQKWLVKHQQRTGHPPAPRVEEE